MWDTLSKLPPDAQVIMWVLIAALVLFMIIMIISTSGSWDSIRDALGRLPFLPWNRPGYSWPRDMEYRVVRIFQRHGVPSSYVLDVFNGSELAASRYAELSADQIIAAHHDDIPVEWLQAMLRAENQHPGSMSLRVA